MPKEARKLADKSVAALKSPGHYPVGGVSGLALKITPKRGQDSDGVARSWILRLTTGETRISSTGKPFAVRRDFGLGGYPDVSLSEARQRAAEVRQQMRAGIDPAAEKKAARAAVSTALAKIRTFGQVAHECHAVRGSGYNNPKHAAQWISTLETYAFPTIGRIPVTEIGTSHLVDLLKPIWLTKHETATRVRQRIGTVLDYAKAAGMRSGDNPADMKGNLAELLPESAAIRKKAPKHHHARVPVSQIASFMADLRTRSSISAKALEFAVLTAARSGEVRGATWGEIDLDAHTWRLSAERMKADRAHTAALSSAAVDLLKTLPKGYPDSLIFSSSKGRELSENTLNKMIKDMHTANVNAKGSGYIDPDQGRIATPHGTARSSFKDWSRRSTARAMGHGNSSPFPDEWSELALAHVNSDATRAAYARDGLLDERRELMQAWADYCANKDHTNKD